MHQFPTRIRDQNNKSTIEKADIVVVSLPNLFPVLCSDIKCSNFGIQIYRQEEITIYCTASILQEGKTMWPFVLGMPGTPSKMSLELYMPTPKKIWRSTIVEVCDPISVPFLCTMYVGVLYLLKLATTKRFKFVTPPMMCYCPKEEQKFKVVSKH